MSDVPSFVSVGAAGESLARSGSNFVKFEENKPVKLYLLHEFECPEDQKPSGNNAVLSYEQYVIYATDERYKLPDGVKAINFPALGGSDDVGKELGLKAQYRGLAIVQIEGEETESVWAFPISIYKQLLSINQDYDSLKGRVLKVTRTGTGLQTKYNIVPLAKVVNIVNEPETDLVTFVGEERTREDIVKKLEENGIELPEVKTTEKKKETKSKSKPEEEEYESV